MKEEQIKRSICAIDLKSFYASVECIDRGLNPFLTPLVVCDTSRGPGTIILAVTPYLKKLYGIPSRLRLYDLPKDIPGLIYAHPRMERYIQKSVEVVSIYLDYVAEEDLHVYSVDEAFLDLTHYLRSAGLDKVSYARRIIADVRKKTGLTVTAGVGTNMFLAKAAMDIEAKKSKDFIASWEEKDVPQKLWNVTPLSKMWGIGAAMEKRLNGLGMYKVGDIAVSDPSYLRFKFGVIGEEIYEHANGRDGALIQEKYVPDSTSLSAGQTLFKDYSFEEAKLIIKESLDELLRRMDKKRVQAKGLVLCIGYSKEGGFCKAMKFTCPSSDRSFLLEALDKLYKTYADRNKYVRSVSLAAFDLSSANEAQLSLFEEEDTRKESFKKAISDVRSLYGLKSVLRASSLLNESNALRRADQIGGHAK